jgi:hypothetical protein
MLHNLSYVYSGSRRVEFTIVTILLGFAVWSAVFHVISFSNVENFFRHAILQIGNTRAKNIAFATLFLFT